MTDPNSIADTYAEVTRAAIFGLIVNLMLAIVKLIGGKQTPKPASRTHSF